MPQPKLTLTVAMPAHNEEKSLLGVLESLVVQEKTNYILTQIMVLCDGCTDATAQVGKKFAQKNQIVKVIDDGKRLGKAQRVAQAFSLANTDVLLLLDADVKIGTSYFLHHLADEFRDEKVGLVGAAPRAMSGDGVIERAIAVYELYWVTLTSSIADGHNIHNNMGCSFAVRRDFYKKIIVPNHIVADDHYIFALAKKSGWKFRHANQAIVYFRAAQTLGDYYNQFSRYYTSQHEHTGEIATILDEARAIPLQKKILAYATTFIHHPLLLGIAILMQAYIRFRLLLNGKNQTDVHWESVASTK